MEMEDLPSSTISCGKNSFLNNSSPRRQNRKRKCSISEANDITIATDASDIQEDRWKLDENVTVGGENHFLNLQISQETSDWNDQVFSKLSVEMMPGVSTPYVVFSSFPDFLENQRHRRSKIIAMMNGDESLGERKVVVDCYKYAMEHIIDIDYEYIDHIPVYRVEKLYESTKTLDKTSMKNWIRHFANNDLHVMSGSKRIKERCKRYP